MVAVSRQSKTAAVARVLILAPVIVSLIVRQLAIIRKCIAMGLIRPLQQRSKITTLMYAVTE